MGRVTEESNKNYLRNHLGLGRNYRRKDICIHLGIPVDTKLEDIFLLEGLEYKKQPELGTRRQPAETYYLINSDDYSCLHFSSGSQVLKYVILANHNRSKLLRNYVSEKHPVLYQGAYHIVSKEVEVGPFDLNFENSNNVPKIRQKMREDGYPVDYTTSLKEICEMLDVNYNQKNLREVICNRIGVQYVQSGFGGVRVKRPVFVVGAGDSQRFPTLTDAGTFFGLDAKQIQRYIENGITFHFGSERYRAYYL